MRLNKLKLKYWKKINAKKVDFPACALPYECNEFLNKDNERVIGKIAKTLALKSPWMDIINDLPPPKWYEKLWDKIQGWWFIFRWYILRYRPEIKQWEKEADDYFKSFDDEDEDY